MPDRPMKRNDTTAKSEWVDFSDHVLSEEHPPEQFREMRRAFYAGYLAAAIATAEIVRGQGLLVALDWVHNITTGELNDFFQEIERGNK